MAKVVVVGAGIVGLSVARAALGRGHTVTVLEQGPVANPQGASYDQHRLIRYQYGGAEGYTHMVSQAFAAWDRVWSDLGESHFENTGTLGISMSPGDDVDQTVSTFRQIGVPHEVLDRQAVERLCPQLVLPESSWGLLANPGGPLLADRIVDGLAAWVAAKGADLRPQCRVAAIDRAAGRVQLEDGTRVEGDLIVVAAGAWLPTLIPDYAALPTYRQALCYVDPPGEYRDAWRKGPCLTDLGPGGNYALTPVRGTGLKFGSGSHRRPGRPSDGFDWDLAEGADVIGKFEPFLRQARDYKTIRMQVGYYVKDETDRFRLDRHGRTVVVTNCDGQMFKFGPLLGERVLTSFEGEQSFGDLARWAAGQ